MGLYGDLSTPAISVELDNAGDEPGFNYETNADMQPGFEFRYGHYGIALSPSLFGEGRLAPERPPTRYFDLKVDYFGSRWAFEAYHQYFRGFYLTQEDHAFRRDNASLALQVTDLNVYRAFGERSRLYRVTEGIRGTGVRFNVYALGSVSRSSLRSPFPLLEGQPEGDNTIFDSLARVTAYSLHAGAGATLNLSLFGLYCDPTFVMAFGPQYRLADVEVDPWSPSLKLNLKLNLGYANDAFDVGMKVENDANFHYFDSRGLLFHSIIVRTGVTLFL